VTQVLQLADHVRLSVCYTPRASERQGRLVSTFQNRNHPRQEQRVPFSPSSYASLLPVYFLMTRLHVHRYDILPLLDPGTVRHMHAPSFGTKRSTLHYCLLRVKDSYLSFVKYHGINCIHGMFECKDAAT
jgi:hypothetical protein